VVWSDFERYGDFLTIFLNIAYMYFHNNKIPARRKITISFAMLLHICANLNNEVVSEVRIRPSVAAVNYTL